MKTKSTHSITVSILVTLFSVSCPFKKKSVLIIKFFLLQAVLRRRDAIQMEYDMVVDELNKRKDEKEQVRKANIQTQRGHVRHLEV